MNVVGLAAWTGLLEQRPGLGEFPFTRNQLCALMGNLTAGIRICFTTAGFNRVQKRFRII